MPFEPKAAVEPLSAAERSAILYLLRKLGISVTDAHNAAQAAVPEGQLVNARKVCP